MTKKIDSRFTRCMPRVFVAGVAFFLISSPILTNSAEATHTTATIVDSIDGSGPGVFAGTLTNLAPVDSADWFSFAADAGDNVTIALDSAVFDPYLILYLVNSGVPLAGDDRTLAYTLVAEDDDSGGGLNSLISIPSLAAGNYVIAVESFSGEGDPLGAYILTVSGSIREVPEPSSAVLLSIGALLPWVYSRWRRER